MTNPPAIINYASVVSRETLGIALKLAALKNIPVRVADI